jgi:hypothetical protein
MDRLLALAADIAARLKARGETVAVAESSAGGLIAAALLSVPGASAYFLGGAVVYTRRARRVLLAIPDEAMAGLRPASEPYATLPRAPSQSATAPRGACPRRALRVRRAMPTATRPATPASAWPGRRRAC